jgi:uncharacterized protein YjbI with pentapeptide repeats
MSYPVWRISMDKDVLIEHEDWVARGKSGPGRLALEDQNLQGARVPRAFPCARFVRCDLTEAAFPLLRLDELELIDCRLDRAVLNSTSFDRASIAGTSFTGASLQLADFNSARIANSNFNEANLERAFFVGATIEHTTFTKARLADAVLDDAHLIDCDLRDCDLSRVESVLDLARTSRTRFVRCDLRGANISGRRLDGTVFDHCRMMGMIGKPEIVSAHSVTEPTDMTIQEIEAAWR